MGSGTLRRARTRVSTSRRRLAAGFTAAVGMTLVAPVLATAPAHAGLDLPDLGGIDVGGVVTDPGGTVIGILDPVGEVLPLTPPTPVIAPGGNGGSITFLGAVVCNADGTVTKTCDALSLTGGPAPLRDRAMDALSGVHGAREEPQGFEAWLAEELDRRRAARREAALRSAVDRRLPPLALQSLDGRAVQLEDFRGRVLLLNFFSSW